MQITQNAVELITVFSAGIVFLITLYNAFKAKVNGVPTNLNLEVLALGCAMAATLFFLADDLPGIKLSLFFITSSVLTSIMISNLQFVEPHRILIVIPSLFSGLMASVVPILFIRTPNTIDHAACFFIFGLVYWIMYKKVIPTLVVIKTENEDNE